jgi:hypothetical protein
MRSLVLLMSMVSVAHADAPSGYQCGPGKPKKGEGCACPSGYMAKRGDENIATCVSLGPLLDRECDALGDAIRTGNSPLGAILLPPNVSAKERDQFGAELSGVCVGVASRMSASDRFTLAQVRCFAAAKDPEAVWQCYERLTVDQREGFEVALANYGSPAAIELVDGRLVVRGRYSLMTEEPISPLREKIGTWLRNHPEIRLEVRVHSDSTGKRADALEKTERQASWISYRIEHYVGLKDRVFHKGMGPDQPIASNKTAAGRAANRRVEIVMLPSTP